MQLHAMFPLLALSKRIVLWMCGEYTSYPSNYCYFLNFAKKYLSCFIYCHLLVVATAALLDCYLFYGFT